MSEDSFNLKVALAGPNGVGKTSLILAVLENTKEPLRGNPVSVEAADNETEGMLNDKRNEIKGGILAGEFSPEKFHGTEEPTKYSLSFGAYGHEINVIFQDYPGGVLETDNRNDKKWNEVEVWIKESPILLIPIDATVLMEGMTTKNEINAALEELKLPQVENISQKWAKGCIKNDSDGLMIFAPVKCETYFGDNDVGDDQSDELFSRVQEVYGGVFEESRAEFAESNNAKLVSEYHPVDTFGCIKYGWGGWDRKQNNFRPNYEACEPLKWEPRGGEDIFIAICRAAMRRLKKKQKNQGMLKWLVDWWKNVPEKMRDSFQNLVGRNYNKRSKQEIDLSS